LQAGYLAAQLALLVHEPVRALQIIDELRAEISFESCRPYSYRIVALELEARAAPESNTGDVDIEPVPDLGARSRLLRALHPRDGDDVSALLADRESWIFPDLARAELLLLVNRDDSSARNELERLVATCAEAGWVSPFLGLDPAAADRLRALPLEDLHPQLASHLRSRSTVEAKWDAAVDDVDLTAREKSLLPLLGTHLSYAEMGEQLFLSVNTVKANLQRLYRKLDAHTRREAVESARRRGMLSSAPASSHDG
jgi:DNA-binding CsgD family transcriptional regulator